jgi:hypothetical protein
MYFYSQEVNGELKKFVAVSESKDDKPEILPTRDSFDKDVFVTRFQDILDDSLKQLKADELLIQAANNKQSYRCKSGEKKFATKFLKAGLVHGELIKAYIQIEKVANKKDEDESNDDGNENSKYKLFPLDIQLTIAGVPTFSDKSNQNIKDFSIPENLIGGDNEKKEIKQERMAGILKAAILAKLEGDYYSLSGKISYSTESACTYSEDVTLEVHKNQIEEYEAKVNQNGEFKKQVEICEKESESKIIQSNFAYINICKINTCIKRLKNVENTERKHGSRSGFVNKLLLRRVGVDLNMYEDLRNKYGLVLKKLSLPVNCPSSIVEGESQLLGNENTGIMCFANVKTKISGISECGRSILGISADGKSGGGVSHHATYNISGGKIDFSSAASDYASRLITTKAETKKVVALDPDEEVKSENSKNIEVIRWKLSSPNHSFEDYDAEKFQE